MEILSLGQKLKRARVYMGYTLKDICEDKISVSKLSCIENDKIKPEPWILKHICDKLKLTVEYLNQDVKEQIEENITELNESNDNYIQSLEYFYSISLEKNYLEVALKIIQSIFSYYMKNNNLVRCHDLIPDYYDLATKINDSMYIYYYDMGEFIFKNEEYNEAYGYFNNVISILNGKAIINNELYFKALSKKVICLLHLKKYSEAVNMLPIINKYDDFQFKNDDVIMLNTIKAILVLIDSKKLDKYKKIENEVFSHIGKDINNLIDAKYNIAYLLYLSEYYSQSLEYIEELANILSIHKIQPPLNESLLHINLLIKNQMPEKALDICDKLLNLAIKKQDDENIEKLYYHKGHILDYMGNYTSAEVYYNLSLDLLTKTNKNKEMSDRYFEIGCLYNKMNNTKDAIKYINTAITIKNKI